jgi:hypothetical protein
MARASSFAFRGEELNPDGRIGEKLPWPTPARDHRDGNGYRLPGRGDATWKAPKGDFCYGEFILDTIDYFPSASPPS